MYSWLTFNDEDDKETNHNCGYYYVPRNSWDIFKDNTFVNEERISILESSSYKIFADKHMRTLIEDESRKILSVLYIK